MTDESPVAGRTLASANDDVLPDGVLVVAVERDQSLLLPQGNTVIEAGTS